MPGALLRYDLPDLAAALAPARVLVLNPQEALGAPLAPGALAATYERARQMAAQLGGELEVETQLTPEARREALVAWAAGQPAQPVRSPSRAAAQEGAA